MKILLVHSNLAPYGGDSIYTLRLGELLSEKGHEVAYWGMKNKLNISHKYSNYELNEIDFKEMNKSKNIINGVRVIARTLYSFKARKLISFVLKDFKPDIVHLQAIHPFLTTSIIHEIKNHNIPIVWTQHNLSLVCCSGMISREKICEKCKPNKFYYPIIERCKRDSLRASLVGTLQLYFNYYSKVNNKVDKIITISNFFYKKLQEFGFDKTKLVHIPNFFNSNSEKPIIQNDEDIILYFGRLVFEKGVDTLINAFSQLNTDSKLYIVGSGPQKEELEVLVQKKRIKNVLFFDQLKFEELKVLISKCRFTVVPSVCYDNFPNTVLESFYFSKPVIGSNIGGIPEMVIDKQTGLLFNPGDSQDLSEKIDYLLKNLDYCKSLGEKAYNYLNDNFSSEIHYDKLLSVYLNVINSYKN